MSIKQTITIDEAIAFLDSLVKIDPGAMAALINARVPCNDAMRDHPTVQVAANKDGSNARVGFLGIMNGLFGADENHCGAIAAYYDVVCPQGCEEPGDVQVGDRCQACGQPVKLGSLTGFIRFPPRRRDVHEVKQDVRRDPR